MESNYKTRYAELQDSLDRIKRALEGSSGVTAEAGLAHLRWVAAQVSLLHCVFDEIEPGCPQEVEAGSAVNRLQSAIPRESK